MTPSLWLSSSGGAVLGVWPSGDAKGWTSMGRGFDPPRPHIIFGRGWEAKEEMQRA